MDIDPIRIDGLVEFQRNLRRVDTALPKTLRIAHNAAAELVVDWARARAPKRTGRSAASIRATSSQRESKVTGGGARVPWYPWLDFGGRVGPGKSVARPFIKAGRYIYPGYEEQREDVADRLLAALTQVCVQAGVPLEG